ncbi:MAG: FtsW/RodA/SpoVE family cell cycle protein [Brumimicrobium sp.]|nr:FtsW/RodA/SpoVE family cell cycle protein [Brumimicrobium sp.]
MKDLFKYVKGDKVLWIIALLLMGVSIVTVYSFVPILIKTQGGSSLGYLFKHLTYIIIGLIMMYWLHTKDPIYLEKLSKFIFYISIGLLIFTFFFGVKVNDATRWVRIPIIGLTFQSSDFAKLALVIYISRRLVSKQDQFDSWKDGFWPLIWPVILVSMLIAKDNFSTAGLLVGVIMCLFFIAKVPLSKISTFTLSAIGLFGIFVLIHFALPEYDILPRLDTWINRVFRAYGDDTISQIDNMQAINAKLAIHNGGYFGVGIGDGDLKYYTPEAYADFYYSSFVEELGLKFAVPLILLYLILFYRILRIGLNAERLFETYICIGIGLIFMAQALTNMFVCTGIIPVTGQNMPFLGMGGSAMVMSCVSLGIVLSVGYKNSLKENKVMASENQD